jgi:hypothetical protein
MMTKIERQNNLLLAINQLASTMFAGEDGPNGYSRV